MTHAPTNSATKIAASASPKRLFLRESSGGSIYSTKGSIAAAANSRAR